MIAAVALFLLTEALPAQSWVRATSPHAEVLSDGSDAQARRAAERIEGAHRVLLALFPAVADLPASAPVVVAFADPRAFARFVPARAGEPQRIDGVILGGADRTYLAVDLGAEREDPFDSLAHEYTHFVLNAALPAQPPWMGEGAAELVANAVVGESAAVVGRAQAAHLARLARERPMPVRALLAVGYLSPVYQGGEGRENFYASSWALVHWIVAGGRGGAAALSGYARSIADGEDAEAAFARWFGVAVDAADAALAAHLAAVPFPLLSLALPPSPPTPVALAVATAGAVDRHLADLATRAGREKEHKDLVARAEAAALADPSDPRGRLALAQRQLRAIWSRGDVATDAEEDRAVALLEPALAADPDLADAADLLARLRPNPVAHRIALLRRAVARQPERAELAFTLSGLYIRRHDYAEAARVLRRARAHTRDDAQSFLADHLLARIAGFAGETAEARGTLEAVECLERGALAFRLRTPSGVLRLVADSPRALFLYDAEGETYERELTCGPSGAPVVARYRLAPPGSTSLALISLSFEKS